jgi:hypothetical protein
MAARGCGREFLAEMDSHFPHLGPGANYAPVSEHLRREFAAEIEKMIRTTCCDNAAGGHELAV